MSLAQKCRLIHGPDTYHSRKALKAITNRFLSRPDSMADLATYDMEDASLESVKQQLLTIPFFVTHRLFIIKNLSQAPKATQEGVMALLPQVGDSTYVVLYENRAMDKKLSLYKWLEKNVKVETYTLPSGVELTKAVRNMAATYGANLDPQASTVLLEYFGSDLQLLDREVSKLASYVQSQGQTTITTASVSALCTLTSEESVFQLTDTLRQGSLKDLVKLYQVLVQKDDPLLIGGTVASQIRTLAKIILATNQGKSSADSIAQATKLHPYVVKLSLGLARSLSAKQIKKSYQQLLEFDTKVKNGSMPPNLGGLLLIIRLHDTLKTSS